MGFDPRGGLRLLTRSGVLLSVRVIAAIALVTALPTAPARAQTSAPASVRAGHVSGPMRLDGIPDEAAWRTADSIADFRQQDPAEGQASTERTVVRFLAAEDGLWVAFWNYDRHAGRIVHSQLRRDADLDSDDHVSLFLDPQGDRRSGHLFQVNPNGAMYDGEFAGGHEANEDWNGVWDARACIGADGWTAEIFIPWQTLRYRRDGSAWGLNVGRFIRDENETTLWRGWLRQQGLLFTDEEGQLTDLGALPARRLTEWRPYFSWSADDYQRAYAPDGSYQLSGERAVNGKAGLDGKVAVTPTLTLDLTARTDFAQVEADQQVVNLSRFPLFFPEKRPFFLEASGVFDFGQEERTMAFYSRRIGLGHGSAPVPLDAGLRLTGRLGAERIGLLAVRTGCEREDGVPTEACEDAVDVVTRLKHDVLSRGYVGGIVTGQGGPGVRGTRVTAGADYELPFVVGGQNLVFSGYAMGTRDSSGAPTRTAGRFFIDYPNDWSDSFFGISWVEAGFNPVLGFVRQTGVWRHTGAFRWSPRPHVPGLRRLELKFIEWDVSLDIGGGLNNAMYEIRPLGAEFQSGDRFEVNLQRREDVPGEAFDVWEKATTSGTRRVTIPAGRYAWNRVEAQFESSSGRPVAFDFGAGVGQFYTGTSSQVEATIQLRLAPHIIASWNTEVEWVRLPQGRFTAQTMQFRVDYAFTPRLGTMFWTQWDNESDRLTVNARVHWIPKPGSDAYLVWDSAWPSGLEGDGSWLRRIPWRRPSRGALVGKLVYYFRA